MVLSVAMGGSWSCPVLNPDPPALPRLGLGPEGSWGPAKQDARRLAKALLVHVATGEFGIPTPATDSRARPCERRVQAVGDDAGASEVVRTMLSAQPPDHQAQVQRAGHSSSTCIFAPARTAPRGNRCVNRRGRAANAAGTLCQLAAGASAAADLDLVGRTGRPWAQEALFQLLLDHQLGTR